MLKTVLVFVDMQMTLTCTLHIHYCDPFHISAWFQSVLESVQRCHSAHVLWQLSLFFVLVGFPGYSSSASETDSASLADVHVSSTSFDRDRRPGHLRTRTDGSLYSQMRLSLMLAVQSKRSSWSWTGTLFCCVLRRCNSHPLITATLNTQKKIQQYQSLWSDISISNRSTRPLCSLYSYYGWA